MKDKVPKLLKNGLNQQFMLGNIKIFGPKVVKDLSFHF